MKVRTMKPFRRLALRLAFMAAVLSTTLTSCGDDVYYDIRNTDEALCGKSWVEYHYILPDNGQQATYKLRFDDNGSGQELTSWVITAGTNTIDRDITWRWTDDSRECIQILYNDGASRFLDNVWVREHYLSAEIDGIPYTFIEANYH